MPKGNKSSGDVLRISIIAVLIPIVLLAGSLIYVELFARGYGIFQKIGIVLVALVFVGILEALLWVVLIAKRNLMLMKKPK